VFVLVLLDPDPHTQSIWIRIMDPLPLSNFVNSLILLFRIRGPQICTYIQSLHLACTAPRYGILISHPRYKLRKIFSKGLLCSTLYKPSPESEICSSFCRLKCFSILASSTVYDVLLQNTYATGTTVIPPVPTMSHNLQHCSQILSP
jgi:hypothetical protein